MKVIFVASGNKVVGKCSSFVQSQYDSLVAEGLDMQLFPVVGHGAKGFVMNLCALRRIIKTWQPDIIHAHYSTFGILSWIASVGIRYPKNHQSPITNKPKILVSILGSFPTRSKKWRLVRYCIQHLWDGTLVKSERTRAQLGLDLPIIPNGVNLDIFHPMSESEREKARLRLFGESEQSPITNHQSPITNVEQSERSFEQCEIRNHKYIIWCSNPSRPEKNWALAERAVEILKSQITNHQSQIELVPVYNKTPQEVATYMNAADCMLLTSMSEGSPNVIKEAMACNCPIVTTNVGDVIERLQDVEGCYVSKTEHEVISSATHTLYHTEVAQDIARLLGKALAFGQRTNGHDRIIQDGLTLELTAKKIINLYEFL